ncbi:MAG: ABC transporter permease [Bacteroidales bacterium]|jgi:ABC-2 type transport system permease protein|nr:ABC transporter permease [Bacteroidales bacterium]
MEKNLTYIGQWLRDTFSIFVNELKLVFSDSGVMLIFCFAGLVYPILYNYIYHDGVVDEMPVAVVDLSQGSYSRRYLREFDATRECAIAYDCVSMAEAEKLMAEQKVHGIVYIPADFDEKLARMEQATLSTYADMSTFLYYKNMTMASNLVMLDEVHQIQAEHYAAAGYTGQDATQLIEPVQYDTFLRYNPTISFTMFFVYMALFMILQQVMFYGSTTLAGTLREEHRSFARLTDNLSGFGMGRVVLGRGAAYFLIFMVLGVYGALLVPHLFHLPQHCYWWEMLILLTFFVADIIYFSFFWSTFITKRETVLVLLLFLTPMAVFLTGFTWPASNFPPFWKAVSYLFPSTFGCRAFMNLSNAGTLEAIAPELIALSVQIVIYYILTSAAVYLENRVIRADQAR